MIALASKRKEKAVDSSPAYAIREGSQEMTDSALVAASKIVVTVRRKALHRRHLEEQGLEAKASGATKTKTGNEIEEIEEIERETKALTGIETRIMPSKTLGTMIAAILTSMTSTMIDALLASSTGSRIRLTAASMEAMIPSSLTTTHILVRTQVCKTLDTSRQWMRSLARLATRSRGLLAALPSRRIAV